jgi:hypothetical protein
MDFDAFKELQFMYDKLLHYGQTRWQNIVLPTWEKAYRKAYNNVFGNTVKTRFGFFVAILGGIIGAQTIGIQVFFAPIFFGLSKWTGDAPQVPLTSTAAPEDFIADRKVEFGKMLDACQGSIEDLIGRIKSGEDVITEVEFESFLARALLSPIWYPPKDLDFDYLTKRLERRMWAQAWMDARDDSGVTMDAHYGIERIGPLPADTDVIIDYGKMNSLYDMAATEMWSADRVADRRLEYINATSEVARDWRRWLAPMVMELARPARATRIPITSLRIGLCKRSYKVGLI